MNRNLLWIGRILLSLFCGGGPAAHRAGAAAAPPAAFSITDDPSWVAPPELDPASLSAPENRPDISDGVSWILSENQIRLAPPGETNAHYCRYVLRFLTEPGIHGQSTIQVQYDPAGQRLEFHRLRLWRNGSSIDLLPDTDFHTLQRELNLEGQMLDGRITVVALPPDVRVGDALEAAYSVHGGNPVFEGRFFGTFLVGWSVPLARQRLRILCAEDRPLRWWPYAGAPDPLTRESNGWREWIWDLADLRPGPDDADLPDGLRLYPSIGLGEFSSWTEVADWALRQYPDGPLPGDIAPRLQAWRDLPSPEDRLLAALDFVQAEIRYFGLELAEGSHRANPPALILQRRFGDCKDKASLLCALLRAMDIEAHPALVHTALRGNVRNEPPSPLAFNHAIVGVRLDSGLVWVDPTRSHQRGRLADRFLPPYGHALLVEPGASDLSPVRVPASSLPDLHVEEHFDISAFDAPATLSVCTRFAGREAESMRARLADTRPEALGKEYLNYYASRYPGIALDAPVSVEDPPGSSFLLVRERYRIDPFWRPAGTGSEAWVQCEFNAQEILARAAAPRTLLRTHPLGLLFPLHVRQTITARLPGQWPVLPQTVAVDSDFLRYSSSVAWTGNLLTLDYRLQTLADAVPADRVAAHLLPLEQIRNDLRFTLSHPLDESSEPWIPHWSAISSASMLLLLAIGIAVALGRPGPTPPRDPAAPPPLPQSPSGLGGWLALFGLGLVLRPFMQVKSLFDSMPCLDLSRWLPLTQPGGAGYHPLWAPILLFELHISVVLLVWALLVLFLYARRRRSFRRQAIALFLFEILCLAIIHAYTRALPHLTHAMSSLAFPLGTAIRLAWIAYLLRSRRVAHTFIRP